MPYKQVSGDSQEAAPLLQLCCAQVCGLLHLHRFCSTAPTNTMCQAWAEAAARVTPHLGQGRAHLGLKSTKSLKACVTPWSENAGENDRAMWGCDVISKPRSSTSIRFTSQHATAAGCTMPKGRQSGNQLCPWMESPSPRVVMMRGEPTAMSSCEMYEQHA